MSTVANSGQGTRHPDLMPVEELIRAQTGTTISHGAFGRRQKREETTRKQLEMLARVAESDESVVKRVRKDTLWLVGLMSGEGSELIRLPRRVLLPGAAERSRKDTLNAFVYFLRKNPGCRHMIITCGTPVKVQEVRETLRKTCDRIRRLRAQPWFQEIGEVVMRSAEFTVKVDKYHCHVHLVIRAGRAMAEEDWSDAQQKLQNAFGTVVLDDKTITDEYGAGQYLFDGNEIANINPFDLCDLQELMKHVRTHEPQGSFRAFCRELRQEKLKITWCGNKLVKVRRNDGSFQCGSCGPSCEDDDLHESESKAPAVCRDDHQVTNRLVRITAPFARAKRVREPHLMLLNYSGDFQDYLRQNPQLADFREELMPQWNAGLKMIGEAADVHSKVQVSDQADDQAPAAQPAEGDADDLIDPADWPLIGINPADFLWRPIPRPRCNASPDDETSFPF
jgi:hypothetical protein